MIKGILIAGYICLGFVLMGKLNRIGKAAKSSDKAIEYIGYVAVTALIMIVLYQAFRTS